jgi:hypothetical protein
MGRKMAYVAGPVIMMESCLLGEVDMSEGSEVERKRKGAAKFRLVCC